MTQEECELKASPEYIEIQYLNRQRNPCHYKNCILFGFNDNNKSVSYGMSYKGNQYYGKKEKKSGEGTRDMCTC